ncbi:MAG: M67 family metallopeptidase, partial [Butyricicoccaceae bacterium]
ACTAAGRGGGIVIVMTAAQVKQFTEHAKRCVPEEACGLLAGVQDGDKKIVHKLYITENVDHTNEHFTIDPREHLNVLKDARQFGWRILGNIHSHPETPSRPSEEDKRLAADPAASYLILSLSDPAGPVLKSFRIEKEISEQEELLITEEE